MKSLASSLLAILLLSLLCYGTALASPPASYHLLKKVPLGAAAGGGEYFDYITIDPTARRVYVSHGTEVKVVDADSGAEAGTITGLKRCHGIALVNEIGKGFITDGDAGAVVVFDAKTLKVTGSIKAAPDADAIIYDPASKHIFSFNGNSHNATIIDPKSEAVLGTIDLGGVPENAAADGKGTVYNNNEELNIITVIDSKTLAIKAKWPVAPAGGPTALAIDREHKRIFSAGRNPQFLVAMDSENGRVIQSFPISAGVDMLVFEPETGLIFCSTRDGMIHIFHEDTPDKFSAVEEVRTEFGAKTMALDPKTHRLFVSTSDFNKPPASGAGRPAPVPGTFRLLIYGR
jgi:DNA-binding beta-propeller fold protein YncE